VAVNTLDTLMLDTLIVFGYRPVEAGGKLTIYARLAALAAGTLLEHGAAKRLLVTGGRTGGDALTSEAALLASYLARYVSVSPGQVRLEEHASDTLDNLVLSANLLDAQGHSEKRLGFSGLRDARTAHPLSS